MAVYESVNGLWLVNRLFAVQIRIFLCFVIAAHAVITKELYKPSNYSNNNNNN